MCVYIYTDYAYIQPMYIYISLYKYIIIQKIVYMCISLYIIIYIYISITIDACAYILGSTTPQNHHPSWEFGNCEKGKS